MEDRPLHLLVAENLGRIAEARDITLAEVAERAGIDPRELFAVLTGQYDADLDWLRKLARALDVRMSQLVVDRDQEPGESN